MPSGPKKRRAERKKNVLLSVKIEEGLAVKPVPDPVPVPVPVEVHEPVAAKIEPVHVEAYEPVVHEPRGVGIVDTALVGSVEPVAESSIPVVGLVELVAVSSMPVVGLVEPIAESSVPVVGLVEQVGESSVSVVGLVEPIVKSSMAVVDLIKPLAESSMAVVGLDEPGSEPVDESSVACNTDSFVGIVVVDNGDETPRKDSDEVNGKEVDQPPPPGVDVEVNCLVQKSLINGGVKLTTKVELEEIKKTIEEQLRVVEQVTVNLRQILASFD